MENTPHNPTLRQKLDQHDFGYRLGAWENFENLMQAQPVAAPKKSFWNYKKWFAVGAVAATLAGSMFFFNQNEKKDVPMASPLIENQTTSNNPESTQDLTKTPTKGSISTKNNTVEIAPVEIPNSTPHTTTKSSMEASSHHDDNHMPHETADLKIRPQQQFQRIQRGANEDNTIFRQPKVEKHDEHSKKNQELHHNKVPDAHELDDLSQKKKN